MYQRFQRIRKYICLARVCPHVGRGGGCGGTGGNSLDWVERAARGADLWQGTRASTVISHRLFLIGIIGLLVICHREKLFLRHGIP